MVNLRSYSGTSYAFVIFNDCSVSLGTMTDAEYPDDPALLAITPAQTESLLHHLEQAARDTDLDVNANKTEFMDFKHEEPSPL